MIFASVNQILIHALKTKRMAKQKSVVKLRGTIDDLTFYESQDGLLVRKKTSISKDRINTDASFQRTRENNAEFANAAAAVKLVKDTFRIMASGTADNRVSSRLNKTMMSVKTYDTVNVRGARTVAEGITDPLAKKLLEGFEMNINASLSGVLISDFQLDQVNGNIDLSGFIPKKNTVFPGGATHVALQSGFASIDFAAGKSELQLSPVETLLLDQTSSNVSLQPASIPQLVGTKFYLLKISFFQLVNGVQYELQNGTNSAMAIIAVN